MDVRCSMSGDPSDAFPSTRSVSSARIFSKPVKLLRALFCARKDRSVSPRRSRFELLSVVSALSPTRRSSSAGRLAKQPPASTGVPSSSNDTSALKDRSRTFNDEASALATAARTSAETPPRPSGMAPAYSPSRGSRECRRRTRPRVRVSRRGSNEQQGCLNQLSFRTTPRPMTLSGSTRRTTPPELGRDLPNSFVIAATSTRQVSERTALTHSRARCVRRC